MIRWVFREINGGVGEVRPGAGRAGRRPLHWSVEAGWSDLRAGARVTGVCASNNHHCVGLAVGEKGACHHLTGVCPGDWALPLQWRGSKGWPAKCGTHRRVYRGPSTLCPSLSGGSWGISTGALSWSETTCGGAWRVTPHPGPQRAVTETGRGPQLRASSWLTFFHTRALKSWSHVAMQTRVGIGLNKRQPDVLSGIVPAAEGRRGVSPCTDLLGSEAKCTALGWVGFSQTMSRV